MHTHVLFKDKELLGDLTLLADPDPHTLSDAFGVLTEIEIGGEPAKISSRTTFIIASDGTITHVFPKVKPEGHPQEVLDAIDAANA